MIEIEIATKTALHLGRAELAELLCLLLGSWGAWRFRRNLAGAASTIGAALRHRAGPCIPPSLPKGPQEPPGRLQESQKSLALPRPRERPHKASRRLP